MKKSLKITTATALSAVSLLGVLAPSTAAATADSEHPIPPVLAYIRECESGGDYRAVGPGGAGGAYQFMEQAWAQYGDPSWRYAEQAPRDAQDTAALKMYRDQGERPWFFSKNCWEKKLKAKEEIVDPEVRQQMDEAFHRAKEFIRQLLLDLGLASDDPAHRVKVHFPSSVEQGAAVGFQDWD